MVEPFTYPNWDPTASRTSSRHRMDALMLSSDAAPLLWPSAPLNDLPQLSPERPSIHVWLAALNAGQSALESFADMLSPRERERAGRFHFERDRLRFIAGRGLLRNLLARYLSVEPKNVELIAGAFGKPELAHQELGAPLHFNLAHSENLALFAFTRVGPVGTDLERVRSLDDAEELVARFFSQREHAAFQRLPPEQKPDAFFNLWTRKEAWLKATGEGISRSLHLVEVSFVPGEPAALVNVPPHLAGEFTWHIRELRPAAEYAAALAWAGPSAPVVHCWKWDEQAMEVRCAEGK